MSASNIITIRYSHPKTCLKLNKGVCDQCSNWKTLGGETLQTKKKRFLQYIRNVLHSLHLNVFKTSLPQKMKFVRLKCILQLFW